MNFLKQLEVNKKIEMEVTEGPYTGNYQSKIVGLENDSIKILAPMKRGEVVPLRVNTVLSIMYTGEKEVYSFRSRIIDRIKDSLSILIISPPLEGKIERIQRREYFRLEVQKEISYAKVDEKGNPVTDFGETITSDISGGGLNVRITEKIESLQEGNLLKIFIDIPEIKEKPIIGKIVRIKENKNKNEFQAGIKFLDLDEELRDIIVNWLFEKQREFIRKGLL